VKRASWLVDHDAFFVSHAPLWTTAMQKSLFPGSTKKPQPEGQNGKYRIKSKVAYLGAVCYNASAFKHSNHIAPVAQGIEHRIPNPAQPK
jgi:hypothetical protein